MDEKELTDEEWKERLHKQQYDTLRCSVTELHLQEYIGTRTTMVSIAVPDVTRPSLNQMISMNRDQAGPVLINL
jgi:hypothetical protein